MMEHYWKTSKVLNFLQNVMCQPRTTWISLWPAERICLFYVWWNVKNINNVRWKKFDQKLQIEYKVADSASLFPCKQVLLYHAKWATLTAYSIWHVWRNLRQPIIAFRRLKDNNENYADYEELRRLRIWWILVSGFSITLQGLNKSLQLTYLKKNWILYLCWPNISFCVCYPLLLKKQDFPQNQG